MELVKRYLYSFSLGIQKVFWGGIVDYAAYGGKQNSYFSNVGLIYKDGAKKLAYDTLKLMISKLKDFEKVARIDLGDDNLYLLKFEFSSAAKLPVYVLWKEAGAINVDLSDLIAGEAKVTTIKGRVTGETAADIAISQGPKFIEIQPTPTLTPTPTPTATSIPRPAAREVIGDYGGFGGETDFNADNLVNGLDFAQSLL